MADLTVTPTETSASSHNDSRTSLISSRAHNKPIGIQVFGSCFRFDSIQSKRIYHKSLVLILTFIAYTAFHMGRRPLSVVKNILNRNCSQIVPPVNVTGIRLTHQLENVSTTSLANGSNLPLLWSSANNTSCNYAPFDNDETADKLLALLDTAFLSAYAISMFVSGIIAERMNLRYFITLGCMVSGFGLLIFGAAKPLGIHSLFYFVIAQVISGIAQSVGWPVVVTCVSNWFEPKRLGLIYGIWNSHTNLGNILGATIAGFYVEKDWAQSFIVPGLIMILVAIVLFLFLVPTPESVNLIDLEPSSPVYSQIQDSCRFHSSPHNSTNQTEHRSIEASTSKQEAVSFLKALAIPGVVEYSFCLFFSKLVSYTFLYWLPRFIAISTLNSSEHSAYLSTPFDMGGIIGAIVAGHLSDRYQANGITCTAMLILTIPSMFVYQEYGPDSSINNILLQLWVGFLVNGPYCLITTSVSADLGNRIKDGRAMATVAAIIDGMGSFGAVVGPLAAGFASNSDNWEIVFLMLMIADVLAALSLVRITFQEIRTKLAARDVESKETR